MAYAARGKALAPASGPLARPRSGQQQLQHAVAGCLTGTYIKCTSIECTTAAGRGTQHDMVLVVMIVVVVMVVHPVMQRQTPP